MADIGLRCVERARVVPDVLRAVEHSEGQPGEEVARRQQASYWSKSEAGTICNVQPSILISILIDLPRCLILEPTLF